MIKQTMGGLYRSKNTMKVEPKLLRNTQLVENDLEFSHLVLGLRFAPLRSVASRNSEFLATNYCGHRVRLL